MKRNSKNNSIIHYEKAQNENENYLVDDCTKSLNPEEEISNLFKNIIFKTNSDIVRYPKVRTYFNYIINF